jgi:hypothetical protein
VRAGRLERGYAEDSSGGIKSVSAKPIQKYGYFIQESNDIWTRMLDKMTKPNKT